MHAMDDGIGNGFRGMDPLKSDSPQDSELGFQLQSSHPNNFYLLHRLIDLYGADLFRWIRILLYNQTQEYPSTEQILTVFKDTLRGAISHVEAFHGQESAFNWLFAISYKTVKRQFLRHRVYRLFQGRLRGNEEISRDSESFDWSTFDQLKAQARSVLILRYLFDRNVQDIANILEMPTRNVHKRLMMGRKKFLQRINKPHLEQQIQVYHDGLMEDDPDEINIILQHLDTCDLCKTFAQEINNIEKILRSNFHKHWAIDLPAEIELDSYVQSIIQEINTPISRLKDKIPLRQATWFMGISVLFVCLAVLFIRMTPAESEFPTVEPTSTPALPAIIEAPSIRRFYNHRGQFNDAPQYIDPAFSDDGKWAVLASIRTNQNTRSMILSTVDLYNRETNTIKVISESTAILRLPWRWWNLTPGISGDGRWVVYVSSSNDPDINGDPCETPDRQACLDIFLYDQTTDSTTRITQGFNGGAADGDSLAPTISEDGHWLAFWSVANNLADGVSETCPIGGTDATCLFIYLYDLESGKVTRIPIRNIPGDVVTDVDRISLSADGRYVGFTATQNAQADQFSINNVPSSIEGDSAGIGAIMGTTIPDIQQSSEAIVYDRVTGTYEFENQAQDGTPGNGASSSPVLSANGRYVAFISFSANLVNEDSNQYSDVFVRDRETGNIELISVTSDGKQGNNHSGNNIWGRGFYSIDLSNDGRYVAFISYATNLGQKFDAECDQGQADMCEILYIHDRQTSITKWVSALPHRDISFFLQISSDGRWLMFMQSSYNCTNEQSSCSNVMLYDTQHEWLSNLTKFEDESQLLPWSYSQSLSLPWGSWESSALAFSPDGKTIAIGGTDSKVRIWDISQENPDVNENGAVEILKADGIEYFSSLVYTPDGEWLAAGTEDGVVDIWSLSDHKLLYQLKDQVDPIKKLLFLADNQQLIIATLNKVWLWNIGNHQLINDTRLDFGNSTIYAVDIAPQGNMLATARGDGTVWIQDFPSGEVIGRIRGSQVPANKLKFSEDGSLLAIHSSDGRITIWLTNYPDEESLISKFVDAFQLNVYTRSIAFSPDDKYLATTGRFGEIYIIRISDGRIFPMSNVHPNGMAYDVYFSREGRQLAIVFENEIQLWGIPSDYSSTFFLNASLESNTGPEPIPRASANDLPELMATYPIIGGETTSLNQIADLLKFPLIVPTHLPDFISFNAAGKNDDGSIWLRFKVENQPGYEASLYIYEKIVGNSSLPTMTIGKSTLVTPLQVSIDGEQVAAEYVAGDWSTATGFSPGSGSSAMSEVTNIWLWNDHSASKRLRWRQYGILMAMYFQVENLYVPVLLDRESRNNLTISNRLLDQADLLQIAKGMQLYTDAYTVNTQNTSGLSSFYSRGTQNTARNSQPESPMPNTHIIRNGSQVIK